MPGGKVGGIGDVIRDLASALSDRDWRVTVLVPNYGIFSKISGAQKMGHVVFSFAGAQTQAELWQVPGSDERVRYLSLEHALFSPHGPGQIYCDDGPMAPFASDAKKFAAFSSAAASYVRELEHSPDIVHLHDWHTGCYLMLREFDHSFAALKKIPTVYTIHNLALQGTRPLRDHDSSLEQWFPNLRYALHRVGDPRYTDCVNPMAAAIRLADKLNTVSPTYAQEILRANNPARGFHGGEGLEGDLQNARAKDKLFGILNGCTYSKKVARKPVWSSLNKLALTDLQAWMVKELYVASSQLMARERLAELPKRRPQIVLTSIGRLTAQKATLFLARAFDGKTALENILERLGKDGVFVMLGSGDRVLEQRMTKISQRYKNFLFLCGYSDKLPDLLFRLGDLFLMPSSFEPCGISQLLAMRSGQPCVVHGVGGLKDTVTNGHSGFVFEGGTIEQQAQNFVTSVDEALHIKRFEPEQWHTLCKNAAARRFDWASAAIAYEQELYDVAK